MDVSKIGGPMQEVKAVEIVNSLTNLEVKTDADTTTPQTLGDIRQRIIGKWQEEARSTEARVKLFDNNSFTDLVLSVLYPFVDHPVFTIAMVLFSLITAFGTVMEYLDNKPFLYAAYMSCIFFCCLWIMPLCALVRFYRKRATVKVDREVQESEIWTQLESKVNRFSNDPVFFLQTVRVHVETEISERDHELNLLNTRFIREVRDPRMQSSNHLTSLLQDREELLQTDAATFPGREDFLTALDLEISESEVLSQPTDLEQQIFDQMAAIRKRLEAMRVSAKSLLDLELGYQKQMPLLARLQERARTGKDRWIRAQEDQRAKALVAIQNELSNLESDLVGTQVGLSKVVGLLPGGGEAQKFLAAGS